MKAIFVTATDTGAGKTVVTGLLARYLNDKGFKVVTQKWIQTGGATCDIDMHLKIMRRPKDDIKGYINLLCPYAFQFPGSPHLASRLAKKRIDINKIQRTLRALSSKFDTFAASKAHPSGRAKDTPLSINGSTTLTIDTERSRSINPERSRRIDFVIVEGIGGALVPINKKYLVIDIVKKLGLPVLIVAQNKLGSINHTLMTVEALKARRIKILGILFNNPRKENRLILKDNPRIIKAITKEKILGVLPWQKKIDILYKKFIPIAKRINL